MKATPLLRVQMGDVETMLDVNQARVLLDALTVFVGAHDARPQNDVVERFCAFFSTTETALAGDSVHQPLATHRQIVMWLLARHGRHPARAIARRFNRCVSTVSKSRLWVEDQMKVDTQFRRRVEQLVAYVEKSASKDVV